MIAVTQLYISLGFMRMTEKLRLWLCVLFWLHLCQTKKGQFHLIITALPLITPVLLRSAT